MKPLLRLTIAALAMSSAANSEGKYGTEAEARAMLERARMSIKADKAGTLAIMQNGGGGFTDRDLYVFCANAETGAFTVHPTLMGKNMGEVTDMKGKVVGREMLTFAKEGSTASLRYFWPRPGEDTTPVEKVSYYTKVRGQVCGVGYYLH